MDKARFDGRCALITGGGGDMGRRHALLLAERGANIVAQDIDAERLAETVEAVRKTGHGCHGMPGDVADAAGFKSGLAEAEAAVGPVDILINNAGLSGANQKFEDIDEATFDALIRVNVRGAFFATRAVIGGMKARRYGRIINISSTHGIAGSGGASHYAGAKAALLGFTKTWAREFAPFGITVNAVAPGFINTRMTNARRTPEQFAARTKPILMGRAGEAEDVSYAVAFLASDEAEWITGQVFSPNGGEYIT